MGLRSTRGPHSLASVVHHRALSGVLLLAAAGLLACDVQSPPENAASRSFDRPLLQVGNALASSGYDARVPVRVALSETAATDGVETSSSFELLFDRFVWPRTVTRQAVCLQAASFEVKSLEECTAPAQGLTQPEYNPVRRSVTFRQQPGARLKPATAYRLTVFASDSPEIPGFFAFDGAPLARMYSFDFKTKADSNGAVDELPPSAERYCAAQTCAKACAAAQKSCKTDCKAACASDPEPKTCEATCNGSCTASATACKQPCGCLDGATCVENGDLIGEKPAIFRGCGFSPCHSQGFDEDPTLAAPPPLGLNMSSAAALKATAFGATSHLSQTGEAASIADLSGDRFGRAMPLIDPSNPGNSFLVYKLLINARNFADDQLVPALNDDIMRLRAGAIPGMPMPAATGPDSNRLGSDGASSQASLQLISDWIAAGAVLSCE